MIPARKPGDGRPPFRSVEVWLNSHLAAVLAVAALLAALLAALRAAIF